MARILDWMRRWQTTRASVLGRHVHEKAYAALVLSGGYEEAGDHGRFRVKAGDVIFHEPFEAHLDRFSETGAAVLNLRLPSAVPMRQEPRRWPIPTPLCAWPREAAETP